MRGQGAVQGMCRQRRLNGTADKYLLDLVPTERIHALALQCLPNFYHFVCHLHMFWGSYVEESRDRPRLSVHSKFVGLELDPWRCNVIYSLDFTLLHCPISIRVIYWHWESIEQIVEVPHATLSGLSNLEIKNFDKLANCSFLS